MALPLRFEIGNTLIITDLIGRDSKYYVRHILADGWRLEPYDAPGDLQFHSGDKLFEIYFAGRLKCERFDISLIPERRREQMLRAFEGQRQSRRIRAERRLVFVKAIEKAMIAGSKKGAAIKKAKIDVARDHIKQWQADDQAELDAAFKKRLEEGKTIPGEEPKKAKPFKIPVDRTLWQWCRDYVAMGKSIVGLVSGDVGYHGSHLTPEQEAIAKAFIDKFVKNDGLARDGAAYHRYCKQEKAAKRTPIGRVAFQRRIDDALGKKKLVRDLGAREAKRAFSVSQTPDRPFYANHQGEVDHVFAKVNLEDDDSGVVLGRPWLTVTRERLSGAPSGAHISFLSPSWATLSRGLAHMMRPKDLSAFPAVTGNWSQHGIVDEVYSDRGLDFISHKARASARMLDYDLINLPSYSPWLKGGIERFNRTFHFGVLTYADGIAAYKNPDYDGRRLTKMKVSVFKALFVQWLVDEFLAGEDSRFGSYSADEFWKMEMDAFGGPRGVDDPAALRRSMCVWNQRTIQQYGVRIAGHEFWAPELEELRGKFSSNYKFDILVDPYNLGYIELLVPNGTWIVCYNRRPWAGWGVTFSQNELHFKDAGQLKPGGKVTYDDLARSMERCQADRERVQALGRKLLKVGVQTGLGRYLDLGEPLTPINWAPIKPFVEPVEVPGYTNDNGIYRPTIAPGSLFVPAQPTIDVGRGSSSTTAPAKRAAGANSSSRQAVVSLSDLDADFERRLAESHR